MTKNPQLSNFSLSDMVESKYCAQTYQRPLQMEGDQDCDPGSLAPLPSCSSVPGGWVRAIQTVYPQFIAGRVPTDMPYICPVNLRYPQPTPCNSPSSHANRALLGTEESYLNSHGVRNVHLPPHRAGNVPGSGENHCCQDLSPFS